MNKKYFYDKYITPFNWEGVGYINDNLGPKTEVLREVEKSTKFVYMEVNNELIADSIKMEMDLDFNVKEEEIEEQGNYKVSIPGNHFKDLLKLIKNISTIPEVETQKYELISFITSEPPEIGENVYKLSITADDEVSIRITTAKWVPSFDKITLETAAWSEKNA